MPKKQQSEREIISALKQYEGGGKTVDATETSHRPETVLVGWFRQRQADRCAILPHPESDRLVRRRVCNSRGRSAPSQEAWFLKVSKLYKHNFRNSKQSRPLNETRGP